MCGFWIKNEKIIDVTTSTHISCMIKDPKCFGLTKDYIKSIYEKHNETMGSEQKAREELIKTVVKSGWIRVRKYNQRQNEYWSIQFDNYKKRKKVVHYFICWALNTKKVLTKYESLVMIGYEDNYHEEVCVSDYLQKKINLRR